MGVWDAEPFGNDEAADFANELDEASAQERVEMIGALLGRVADATDDELLLTADTQTSDPMCAIAAIALVAEQCPGGQPVDSGYGPQVSMPTFPAGFRELAIAALDRVTNSPSWLPEYWDESEAGPAWRQMAAELRRVLDPPQHEVLW